MNKTNKRLYKEHLMELKHPQSFIFKYLCTTICCFLCFLTAMHVLNSWKKSKMLMTHYALRGVSYLDKH